MVARSVAMPHGMQAVPRSNPASGTLLREDLALRLSLNGKWLSTVSASMRLVKKQRDKDN